jgi:hypothetical protein
VSEDPSIDLRHNRMYRDCKAKRPVVIENLPKSRAEAKQLGAPKYYTGMPCPNGHVTWRHTSWAQCSECTAIRGHAKRHVTDAQTKETQKAVRAYRRKSREGACKDCGVQYPWYVMEFDHRDGRNDNTRNVTNIKSIKRLKIELEKCDLVCANCHRARTYFRALESGRRTY